MEKCKDNQEREFYIKMKKKEKKGTAANKNL
jgi:hypothetical protein